MIYIRFGLDCIRLSHYFLIGFISWPRTKSGSPSSYERSNTIQRSGLNGEHGLWIRLKVGHWLNFEIFIFLWQNKDPNYNLLIRIWDHLSCPNWNDRSVIMGYQSIRCGDSNIVVAGGQESMSQSVHAMHMRNGLKFGNGEFKDTMIVDGLTDAFTNIHMGITGIIITFVKLIRTFNCIYFIQ